jgi:cell division protein FtsA
MRGSRLESRIHVVSSPSAGKQNVVKAITRAGLEIETMMLEPLAAANSTLTDDDKEYGCALVNIGAEVTTLMIFGRGAVQHTAVFPFGGMHFTKDIAVGLRVSIPEATKIKHFYGCVAGFLMDEQERQSIIEITPVGRQETRQLSKEILCDIMQPRAVELLQHVAGEVFSIRGQISSGVVLTGGGSLSRGMVEIAEQVFDAPTRLGFLEGKHFGGLLDEVQNPEWAVAAGLALASMRSQIRGHSAGGRSASRVVAGWFENFREKFR